MNSLKKTLLASFLLLYVLGVDAQINYLEIEYKFEVKTPKGELYTFFRTLKDDGKSSLFAPRDTSTATNRMVMRINKSKDLGVYFDKANNRLYQYYPILNKDYYIQEDSLIERFQWTLYDTITKEILGYKCKLATCTFRGRKYNAYYTEELPFFTGPWKLVGLPGTILEAATLDGMYKFEPYQVTSNKGHQAIVNPYANAKIEYLTFINHKKLFIKKISDLQRKAQSQEKDEDVNYTFEDNSIELLK